MVIGVEGEIDMSTARTILLVLFCVVHSSASSLHAGIPIPADAPKPLSPEESAMAVELPDGFRLELIAAEPVIRNPSGVCWDERGRLFVCELHGYNLEGQYDIEELNRTGKLDKVVRRIPAPEHARRRAQKDQSGTVKRLIDTDGDGRMDKAEVWADGLPPCFGIVPARGGVIVVCSPDVVYLADRDGDGKAEVRQTLFTGFNTGILERRMNAPQWGLDDWIYVGRGQGGTITGPRLAGPVTLPHNDFRFKADGSAIEPLPEGTHTFGFAFSAAGDRFVVSTGTPAIYVAPLPWRYLSRNPHVSFGSLSIDVGPGPKTYPISKPHPWRTRRAEDPGFEEFYRSRYGAAESTPNGYFTSACSPLVYQDTALPGLRGHLLACEPAQNLVHRSNIKREGLVPRLQRAAGEEEREFLASRDVWFHPIALAHAPDGSVAVVDFYQEIIEDYSAIPRYLQQQYRLNHGERHGRVWRLAHRDMPKSPPADMSGLSGVELAREIASPRFWRRQTARRLLAQRGDGSAVATLRSLVRNKTEPAAVIGALYALDPMDQLSAADLGIALEHGSAEVVVQALRLADRRFKQEPQLFDAALAQLGQKNPRVQIQLALSLGESRDKRARVALAELALRAGGQRWLPEAILSSLRVGGDEILRALLAAKDAPGQSSEFAKFLERLCAMIADSRDAAALCQALAHIGGAGHRPDWQRACLSGLQNSFQRPRNVALSDAGRAALSALVKHSDEKTASLARSLVVSMRIESAAQRKERLARAARAVADVKLPVPRRVAAVNELAAQSDAGTAIMLLASFGTSTPAVREAILDAVFSRREQLPAVVAAMEAKQLPLSALSAVRRTTLLKHPEEKLRQRAALLLKTVRSVDDATMSRFVAALAGDRDLTNGEAVFKKLCANCHRSHGIGFAVGPDLTAEFRRSETTFVQDILAPNATISAGYVTYVVETNDGFLLDGLLSSESPTGITLRKVEGKQQTVLRKDIAFFQALDISMMPEDLVKSLKPKDVADVIAWLRRPSQRRVLFDDDLGFAALLVEGEGSATFERADRYRGAVSLRVTPPQRYSAKIPGWQFRVREKPDPGEYRYIRFAWKSAGAEGVMIEIANGGSWPAANKPVFRYYAGTNSTPWEALRVSPHVPSQWKAVTRDLWRDFGDCTITGIAPTAMGGEALFDAIELLREAP